jgi:hypothetical protein
MEWNCTMGTIWYSIYDKISDNVVSISLFIIMRVTICSSSYDKF